MVWLLLASGCGQKTAPSPAKQTSAPPPTATSAADNRPAVVCFGDSLTAGFGLDPSQTYPDVLQRELDRRGYGYRVVNLGVSGDTSQDGLARLDQALAEKARIVVLEFGANDGLRGQPVDIAERNLGQMMEAFEGAGARVVLAGITLPPNYGPDYIRAFEMVFHELAAQHRVAFVPMIYVGLIHRQGVIQPDGIHPTAKGSNIVADTLIAALKPMLKK